MNKSKVYTHCIRKRDRPRTKHLDSADSGTPEAQSKRLALTGKWATAHLSSTFIGILYARGYLTVQEYEIAIGFMKLSWEVRKILEFHLLYEASLKRKLKGDKQEVRYSSDLTEEEKEEITEKKINRYSILS